MRKQIILFVTTVLFLSACAHKHEWKEADCTSPKTCNECSETEGESIGHDWVEATCETPKQCSVCKETEGEPLGHDWIAADYENPKMCNKCNATEGERLKTFVEEYQIDVNKEFGTEYVYQTITSSNKENPEIIKGKIIFEGIRVVEGEPGYDAEEGYKWYILNCYGTFDPNEYPAIEEKGFNSSWGCSDSKTGIKLTGKRHLVESTTINNSGERVTTEEWNVNGVETVTLKSTFQAGWTYGLNGEVRYMMLEYGVKVPEDYDDLIFYIVGGDLRDVETDLINHVSEENFLAISVKQ